MKRVQIRDDLSDNRTPAESTYTVTSVKRALEILSSFSGTSTWTVTELSRHLKLNKTTVFRLVTTLVEEGYLAKDAQEDGYRLGPQFVSLANATIYYEQLAWKAAPPLQQLSEKTGETVHVGVVHEGHLVNVQIVEGTHVIRMHMETGRRRPAHASALGKMILAHAPIEQVDAYIWDRGLTRYTPNTITDPDEFKMHLKQIREQGWALDNEELEVGLRCLAAPVYDFSGKVFAALAVSAPSFRLHDERINEVRPLVIRTADIVSRLMGLRAKDETRAEV